jgi:hypothetical protein
MDNVPPRSIAHVASGAIAWMLLLFPVAIILIVWGIPGVLKVLGGIFWLMRSFAEAVQG